MTKSRTSNTKTKIISIYVEEELLEVLNALSSQINSNVTEFIKVVLQIFSKDEEKLSSFSPKKIFDTNSSSNKKLNIRITLDADKKFKKYAKLHKTSKSHYITSLIKFSIDDIEELVTISRKQKR